ncbi:hypothetical protein OG580_00290 [Streptomyces sp. NBC_00094]|nr:hypothetical protein [Streptomyces sp. NBC_00094]MCX5388484.1 hypothetical protein [Streptomyces sp. NBC_00094]
MRQLTYAQRLLRLFWRDAVVRRTSCSQSERRSVRTERAPVRISVAGVPMHPPCQERELMPTISPEALRSGPPASPLQIAAPFLPVTARVVAVVAAGSMVKVPVWGLSGTHSVLVRPKPTAVSSVPPAVAAATEKVVDRRAGVVVMTGVARRTRAASRSARGATSTTSIFLPSLSVAVVLRAGLPARTVVPGVVARQLAAVRTQNLSTSEHFQR